MSRSNWLFICALGGWLALHPWDASGQIGEPYAANPSDDARGDVKYPPTWLFPDEPKKEARRHAAVSDNAQQQEGNELQIRQTVAAEEAVRWAMEAAEAAKRQVIVGWWQVAGSVVAAILSVVAVYIARSALRHSQASAKATVEAANAAVKTATIAEQSFSTLERPLVMPQVNQPEPGGDRPYNTGIPDPPLAWFRFKNYGRSPAIIERFISRIVVQVDAPDITDPILWLWEQGGTPVDWVIEQYATTAVTHAVALATYRDKQQLSVIVGGKERIWLTLAISYRDVFGHRYVGQFCFVYDVEQSIMTPFGGEARNRTVKTEPDDDTG